MLHLARLADEWLAIAVALLISTVLAIATTALTMNSLMRRGAPQPPRRSRDGRRPALMQAPALREIWVYLAASPLLWLTLTLVAYQARVLRCMRASRSIRSPIPSRSPCWRSRSS